MIVDYTCFTYIQVTLNPFPTTFSLRYYFSPIEMLVRVLEKGGGKRLKLKKKIEN